MAGYDITAASNERIKRLRRLRDRRHRDVEGVFVVEGPRLIERALAAGIEPLEVYHDPDRVNASGLAGLSVAPDVLDKASYRSTSEGVIAVLEQPCLELEALPARPDGLYLMAEALEKPGNLGAMLRTAEAVGAAGFLVIDSIVDVFNPNCIRASTGALFDLPLAAASLSATLAWLKTRQTKLIAATPDARDDLWSADLTGAAALAVGSEADGISDALRDAADDLVRIPMSGVTDSLNASVSMAVLAYEAVRQRQN